MGVARLGRFYLAGAEMNPKRYYKFEVENRLTMVMPLYHVLAYGKRGFLGSFHFWKEWCETVPRNAGSLRTLAANPNVDWFHKVWSYSLLLAPKLSELQDWWKDADGMQSYVCGNEEIPLEGQFPETYDFLARLLVLNLEMVRESPDEYPGFEARYLELAQQVLHHEEDSKATVELLRVIKITPDALIRDTQIPLEVKHALIKDARNQV